MKYIERFKELNLNTKVPLYLCDIDAQHMLTFHEGNIFEGDTPEWMQSFVTGDSPILPFEQDGMGMYYIKWILSPAKSMAFLDDQDLSNFANMMNYFVFSSPSTTPEAVAEATPTKTESNMTDFLLKRVQHLELELQSEKNMNDVAKSEMEQLNDVIMSLREQNVDQSIRLKDALAKNLELTRHAREFDAKADATSGSNARTTMTILRDENNKLLSQLKDLERKLKDADNKKGKITPTSTTANVTQKSEASKGLHKVVKALNKVIETSSATHLSLEMLSMVLYVPPRSELERNPEQVKTIIGKLLGMEKSGQLTPFQIKKLNETIEA